MTSSIEARDAALAQPDKMLRAVRHGPTDHAIIDGREARIDRPIALRAERLDSERIEARECGSDLPAARSRRVLGAHERTAFAGCQLQFGRAAVGGL